MIGIVIGLLIVQQFNTLRKLDRNDSRDTNYNAFRAIKVLQENNRNLSAEIDTLREKLKQYTSQAQKINVLQEDIKKNQLIAGTVSVSGPGILLKIERTIDAVWMVDLVNELFSVGAEAIAINGIRLTNDTLGFSHVGQQITLGGVTLAAPYLVTAIGKADTLKDALEQSGGILKRLQAQYPALPLTLTKEINLKMSANPN